MYEIKVSLHRNSFKSRPSKHEFERIKNDLAEKSTTFNRSNIKSLAKRIGEEGHSFCPATFKPDYNDISMSAEKFKQLQLFILDFSNGVTFEEVKKKAELYDLPILFAYEPFSDEYRFRVVFLNDTPVISFRIVRAIQQALITIFPEADSISREILKVNLGGNNLLHFDDSIPEINIETLFRSMSFYLMDRYGKHNYRRKLIEFSKDTGIRLNRNNLLDISILPISSSAISKIEVDESNIINDNNSPSSIILSNIINGEKLSKSYHINLIDESSNFSIIKKKSSIHKPYRSDTINEIESTCRLYQDFQSGHKILNPNELYGLATNLVQIESGTSKFKHILKSNSYFDSLPKKHELWDYSLFYIRGCNPLDCEHFCPYKDSCNHGTNILSTTKPRMERLANYVEVFHPLDEVQEDVTRAIFEAHQVKGKMIQVIKAQTSIGKTTSYLKLMAAHPSERFLIATPTNILKDEVYKKAVKMGIDVIKTPSLEAIKNEMPDEVRRHIAYLYRTGQHRRVHPYIRETIKKKDIPCLREYLEERDKITSFNGSVITTHRYLLNMDETKLNDFDTIIIDEDIIFKSIISNQGEITISELNKLLESATDGRLREKISELIKHFESDTNPTIQLPSFEWDVKDDESEGMSTPFDIPSFCLATHFYCRSVSKEKNLKEDTVTFLKPVTFKNMHYIMVSATVDEGICRKYFGDENVSFYECKKTEYKGTLNQYYMKSMSRSSIDNSPGIIKHLTEKFGISEDRVITFMKYHIGTLHYGNTEGSNALEGQDILVIGTPYHAEFIYKLFAFSLGLDLDKDTEMKSDRIVTHNGYKFPFTTYDDEELRAIHFWMLESELEQAVGRARLLRHPCIVNLFSNFPLWQAVMKDDRFWKS